MSIRISDPKGLMNLRFKCPVCGGYKFGTSMSGSPESTGHCHNHLPDGSMCVFSWSRPVEDTNVFVKKEVHSEKSS